MIMFLIFSCRHIAFILSFLKIAIGQSCQTICDNVFIEKNRIDKCYPSELILDITKWSFPNSFSLTKQFPVDLVKKNYVRKVKNVVFSNIYPVPLTTPLRLVAFSRDVLANLLDLDVTVANQKQFIDLIGGSFLPSRSVPLSHRYGGHQFGYWADQLGDGRAVLIGEYINRFGDLWELQLKGSGKTPYSRRGDGRAVLRSSVREFLCSEAMHYLRIPTGRAAGIIVSDDEVIRDMFYDGHPEAERAAVVLRLAKSWFRIGSLEILEKSGEIDLLKHVIEYAIKHYFPSVNEKDEDRYVDFYWNVVNQTAVLMALWQSVGFAHGVCNTDNFSLLSITIDYGPFGFLDEYNPRFIPNTSDDEGRYRYENQPDVGKFNLEKLRTAILPLLNEKQKDATNYVLKQYSSIYKTKFKEIFRRKLGLVTVDYDDENLVAIFLKMMEDTKSDFTMTFRNLGEISLENLSTNDIPKRLWSLDMLKSHKWFKDWTAMYIKRLKQENTCDKQRRLLMSSNNPRYILRNWMAQQAIERAVRNDFSEVRKIQNVLTDPFTFQEEGEIAGYASKPPTWSKRLKVSCSS